MMYSSHSTFVILLRNYTLQIFLLIYSRKDAIGIWIATLWIWCT